MYQEFASTSFLQVVYRPDSCLLIGRWLCSITEEQLREGYETMRLAAREHDCRHWLMDARRRTDRSRNGPEWVISRFLPQVQQEMGGTLYVAFLVLPNHVAELDANPGVPQKGPGASAPLQYARFIDEGTANAWLERKRRAAS